MKVKSLNISGLTVDNNVFLAPLAGYTNVAFRSLCRKLGAGLTFLEMVSSKGLYYKNENTMDMLKTAPNERIKAIQLFGNDPYIFRSVIESKELEKFDLIDINFGCPMPKIFNNKEGSYLLSDLKLSSEILKECVKTGKVITCKIRIGIKENEFVTEDFCKMAEQSGVSLITVHGRVRDKIYAGEPNYNEIAKAKKSVGIPVIANGGIFNTEDADKMINSTGADGVMIARGGLENPNIFAQLTNNKACDKLAIIFELIDSLKEEFDDRYASITLRKHIALLIKGEKNSCELKNQLFKLENTNDIKEVLNNFFR